MYFQGKNFFTSNLQGDIYMNPGVLGATGLGQVVAGPAQQVPIHTFAQPNVVTGIVLSPQNQNQHQPNFSPQYQQATVAYPVGSAPPPNYSAPPSYGAPPPNYSAPPPSYGAPHSHGGASPPAYGAAAVASAPPPNYRPSSESARPSNKYEEEESPGATVVRGSNKYEEEDAPSAPPSHGSAEVCGYIFFHNIVILAIVCCSRRDITGLYCENSCPEW